MRKKNTERCYCHQEGWHFFHSSTHSANTHECPCVTNPLVNRVPTSEAFSVSIVPKQPDTDGIFFVHVFRLRQLQSLECILGMKWLETIRSIHSHPRVGSGEASEWPGKNWEPCARAHPWRSAIWVILPPESWEAFFPFILSSLAGEVL